MNERKSETGDEANNATTRLPLSRSMNLPDSSSQPAPVQVIGAGLAGCEAAWQIARHGVRVDLIDMKPAEFTPAHHSPLFAELVCSNSLRSAVPENAVGLLKEELRRLGSLILEAADACAIPAGTALAVDRDAFSQFVTQRVRTHPLIRVFSRKLQQIPEQGVVVIATGPLTLDELYQDILRFLGKDSLHFFDAAAPLIEADSIDSDLCFRQSRYDKGSADYLNCPFTEAEYKAFYQALIEAETAEVKDFDRVFEGCMPIEFLAGRGEDAIRYGPLKPVGLRDPRTGKRPYAVVQLRQDNAAASLYNIVGFQTRLRFPEQRRVFRMIPGLQQAQFARYGVMHRNSYLASPGLLAANAQCLKDGRLYFAGQITGVEGYVESCASGFVAGQNAALTARARTEAFIPPRETIMGALQHYIASADPARFQPMNANFGLLPDLDEFCKKAQRKEKIVERARRALDQAERDCVALDG